MLCALLACDRGAYPSDDAVVAAREAVGDTTPSNEWLLVANGRDTLAQEDLAIDGATPHGERRLRRTGETQRLTLRGGPDGVQWEYVVARAGAPARPVRHRVIAGRHGVLVLRGTPLGGVVSVDTLRASRDVLPWLDGSVLVLEQLAHRVRATTTTERLVAVVPVATPDRVQSVRLVRGGADTLHVHHPDGHWWVRLDARGHVREAASPSRRLVLRAAGATDTLASWTRLDASDTRGVWTHDDAPSTTRRRREESVRVRAADGTALVGTLRLPNCADATRDGDRVRQHDALREGDVSCASARWPAVLLLSGAGPQTRDLGVPGFSGYAPFAELADALAAVGIASLRLDDRGAGASGGAAFLHDGATERADARAALAWLGAHPAIDASALALVGHSDGGIRALELAVSAPPSGHARRSTSPSASSPPASAPPASSPPASVRPSREPPTPTVRAVVTLGAPARSGRALAALQRARWQRGVGRTDRERATWDSVRPDASRSGVMRTDRVGDDIALDALAASDPWLRDWLAHDPAREVPAVTVPVLVVHGGTDGQVPVEDADALVALLRARATRTAPVTQHIVPGVNHLLLHDASGDPRAYAALRERTLAPAVVAALVPWLRDALR